ncbi:hypothetical protein WJX74_004664 [Apatococcus lobatus]|uniref:Ankyrin repeat protein n=1 Tax=Apatococcus lobatus TaxID=904363 RepID=A0AAW1RAM6_9CHLO
MSLKPELPGCRSSPPTTMAQVLNRALDAMTMLKLPVAGEGLDWIADQEVDKLLLIPGLQAATITAAAAGDQEALAALIGIVQHYAANEATCLPAVHVPLYSEAEMEFRRLQATQARQISKLKDMQSRQVKRLRAYHAKVIAAARRAANAQDQQLLAAYLSEAQHAVKETALLAKCGSLPDLSELPDANESLANPSVIRPCDPQMQQATVDALCEAAGQGEWGALLWLQAICLPFHEASAGLMAAAAREGQLFIMRLLRAALNAAPLTIEDSRCARFYPDCLRWLLEQDAPCDSIAIEALAKSGDLAALQLVNARGRMSPYSWDTDVTYAAASNGQWPTVRWLRAMPRPCPWDARCTTAAAQQGHLPMLQWLRSQAQPCPWDLYDLTAALAEAGNLSGLQWAISQDPSASWDPMDIMRLATRHGHLNVLHWLNLIGFSPITIAYIWAIAGGQPRMLQWLYEMKVAFPVLEIMIAASNFTAVPASVLMLLADMGWSFDGRRVSSTELSEILLTPKDRGRTADQRIAGLCSAGLGSRAFHLRDLQAVELARQLAQ